MNKLMSFIIGKDIKPNANKLSQATQKNVDEIVRLTNTKQWQEHLYKLHSDPQFLAKEILKVKNQFKKERILRGGG